MDRNKLVTENVKLVGKILQGLTIRKGLYKDAEAEGYLALTLASRSYDSTRGAKFSSWAWIKVRGHILDWLEREDKHKTSARDPQPQNDKVDNSPWPDDVVYGDEVKQAFQSILDQLSPEEALATKYRYDGHTILEACKKAGVSLPTYAKTRSDMASDPSVLKVKEYLNN